MTLLASLLNPTHVSVNLSCPPHLCWIYPPTIPQSFSLCPHQSIIMIIRLFYHLLVHSSVVLVSSPIQDGFPRSQRQTEIPGAPGFHRFQHHDPALLRCSADAAGRCYRHHVQVRLAWIIISLSMWYAWHQSSLLTMTWLASCCFLAPK